MKKYRRNEAPHGETTARWFSNDKESSVSGVTGFMVVQYSTASMDGEAKLDVTESHRTTSLEGHVPTDFRLGGQKSHQPLQRNGDVRGCEMCLFRHRTRPFLDEYKVGWIGSILQKLITEASRFTACRFNERG
jgi:hypothetical protein